MTELGEGIEDTRRRVTIDELVPERADPASVDELLQRLADARLVTLDAGSAEVAHEALIREWPRLRRLARRGPRGHARAPAARARRARCGTAGGREPSDLYRGARLAAAAELGVELNATERAFLDASGAEAGRERRAQVRANRRLRGLLAAATLLLVVAVAGGALALGQRDNARQSQAAAEAQSLTSDAERVGALALGEPTLDRSLLLATAGVTLQDRPATRGDLLTILQQNPAVDPHAAAVQRPGPLLRRQPRRPCAGQRGRQRRCALHRPAHLEAGRRDRQAARSRSRSRRSATRRTVARWRWARAQHERSGLYLVDVATRRFRQIGAWAGDVGPDKFINLSFAFSPDGRRLAVALANWDCARTSTAPWPSASWRSTPTPDVGSGGGTIRSGARRWRRRSCSAATAP